MCLLANEFEKIAEKDIVCYKELKYDQVLGIFVTPFQQRWIGRRVLNGRRLYKARGKEEVKYDCYFQVGGGFVHSYAKLYSCFGSRHVVWECVIPAGTRYWVSDDGTEYASKSLRFVRKMDKFV